jgi:hypothetical protein
MFDVVLFTQEEKKKNKFACKGEICVFYKNRIRVTKVQTTKEDDALYLAHEKKKR